MANVLLIIHVFGLMLSAAGGFGSVVALGYARPAQKQKGGPVRGICVVFTNMSIFGLVLPGRGSDWRPTIDRRIAMSK